MEGAPAQYPEPEHRFGFTRSRRIRSDQARDAVADRILAEGSVRARAEQLLELDPWDALTAEREAKMTQLLRLGERSPLLERAVADLVFRFLQRGEQDSVGFENHPWRYLVLRCSTRVLFEPGASGLLLQELRYARGGGAAIKLLLDVAETALERGEHDLALDAIEALDTTLVSAFNWDHQELMTGILTYRMPYLDERVLACVMNALSPVWSKFLAPRVVGRLVDDCAIERPELVAPLQTNMAPAICPGPGDYVEHLAFAAELFTPAGKAAALEALPYVPHYGPSPTVEQARTMLDALEALRDIPQCAEAATHMLKLVAMELSSTMDGPIQSRAGQLVAGLPDVSWPPERPPSPFSKRLETLAHEVRENAVARSSRWAPEACPPDEDPRAWAELVERLEQRAAKNRRIVHEQELRTFKREWLADGHPLLRGPTARG